MRQRSVDLMLSEKSEWIEENTNAMNISHLCLQPLFSRISFGYTKFRVSMRYLALFVGSMLLAASVFAQVPSGRNITQFDSSDRMLPILIESAMINSPVLKVRQTDKADAQLDYELSKKELLRNVALNSNYSYGNVNTYFPSDVVQPVPLWYSNQSQSMYSVGAGISLNLEQLLGGSRLRREKQQLKIERAEAQLQDVRNILRQQVISQYQSMKLARVVYLQRQAALQSLFVNKEMVDKQFRQGNAKINDQLAAEQAYSDAFLAVEQAKNAYQTQVLLLEEVVGMPITPLLAQYFK